MIFVETTSFTRRMMSLLSDEEYSRLQQVLVERPDIGEVIKGSGGIRKVRWAVAGQGKSGGARIIYYWSVRRDTILMLTAYAKNERQDVTDKELKVLRATVEGEFS